MSKYRMITIMLRYRIVYPLCFILIGGCNAGDSNLFGLCRHRYDISPSITINKLTGESHFDDIFGFKSDCSHAKGCIDFPIMIDIKNMHKISDFRESKNKNLNFNGMYRYTSQNSTWTYEIRNNEIEKLNFNDGNNSSSDNFFRCKGRFDIVKDM